MPLSFEEWLAEVDTRLTRAYGLGVDDGVDWASWDAWSIGATPAEGVDVWCHAQEEF